MTATERNSVCPDKPGDPAAPAVAAEVGAETAGSCPVVGVGASAGGLAAFEAFFSGMPRDKDPGMAFVLVQHLAPDHESLLAELVRRYTRMKVFEVKDGMAIRPNCVYIIPPNRDLALLNGALHLLEPAEPHGHRLPIDSFFRSLAADQHERAIGVVLSGTGSDGTLGVRAIKGEGGMVIAQTPGSTEFDGMPRSAIATGLVDFQLPPEEMPAQISAYAARAFGARVRPADAPVSPVDESALNKVFVLLRALTGHDFSEYKANTVKRRIDRRLAVHQIESMDAYVKFLQGNPAEGTALFRDLLIGVTSFFRDPEVFKALEERVIPRFFKDKAPGAPIRVWSAGCSTGEEAYSLAMLLKEHMEARKETHTIQVFATDLDPDAIAIARAGIYPASIASQVPPERLARWFQADSEGGGYRIHKGIRDMLVFSEHDVIRDPPFSRLDLISCRNLMIYLGGALQQRLLPIFHYALNPAGVLLLGTSESIGDFGDLFTPLDRESRIYLRQPDALISKRAARGRFRAPLSAAASSRQTPVKGSEGPRVSLREVTERAVLQQIVSAAVLVNDQGDVLYLHGRTGMYLEPAPGEAPVNNILKMAREGLRVDLTAALRRAVASHDLVRASNVRVRTNGSYSRVNLSVRPASGGGPEAQSDLYLVVLEEAPGNPEAPGPAAPAEAAAAGETEADQRIAALKDELRTKEEYLEAANEELETTNEDLRSSNEEMQSVNEELQSTNEELETSKEELQSVNEELATVNAELQTKVADLSRTNNDMNNLLAGTGIATVFVDQALHILRFTPAATRLTNLIPGDVGRPVTHIVSNLVGYDRLAQDAQSVLDTLVPKDVEVQARDGKWYMMRIHPYRTLENVIEGAVITFIDISEVKRSEAALRKANELGRLAVVVRDAQDAITVQDLQGRTLAWNPGATRMYGWTESEALALNVLDRTPEALRADELARVQRLAQAETLDAYRTTRLTRSGAVVQVSIVSTALMDGNGRIYGIATTERAAESSAVQNNEAPHGQ